MINAPSKLKESGKEIITLKNGLNAIGNYYNRTVHRLHILD